MYIIRYIYIGIKFFKILIINLDIIIKQQQQQTTFSFLIILGYFLVLK